MKNILTKLNKVQVELKAPKGQFNSFGKYNYRNCEDILEALKPLLDKYKTVINIKDEIEVIGERYYIKATVTILDVESGESIEATAYAREEESKKGMDSSQLTGATSSYARKYALNGLLAIDDNKDSDSTNKHGKEEKADDLITENQIKRMFAIANGNNEAVRKILGNYGHTSSKTVTKKEYEGIIADIQNVI